MLPFVNSLNGEVSVELDGIADICNVDINLVASVHILNVVVDAAWLRIFRASSLLVAASSFAASIPWIGDELIGLLDVVTEPTLILLLLAVGAMVECCRSRRQSSVVLALPIYINQN